MAQAKRPAASYADVVSAPPDRVAELIGGDLSLMPRPAGPAVGAASDLNGALYGPFRLGRGGPGGWVILVEPELRLGEDVLVPDLAGWRRERLGDDPGQSYARVVPDWICEVLSPSTHRHDRVRKMPAYATAGVAHVWLVDPVVRTVEAYRLESGRWVLLGTWSDQDVAPIPPFEAVALELAQLWTLSPPKADEPATG